MQNSTKQSKYSFFLCEPTFVRNLLSWYPVFSNNAVPQHTLLIQRPLSTLSFPVTGGAAAEEARAGPALQARAVLPSGQVLTAVQMRAMFNAEEMPDAAIQSKGYGLGSFSQGDVRCTGTMMKNMKSIIFYELNFFMQ